jgi:dolichol-phosphate mannosyltransferase
MSQKTFEVFVPAYNEEEAIPPLTADFDLLAKALRKKKLVLKVCFIDDGSRDQTARLIQKARAKRKYIRLIRHPQNRGLAGVLETILQVAGKRPTGRLGFGIMDGDNSHPASVFLPMVEKLQENSDVVIASRFQTGGKVIGLAPHRKLYSRVLSFLFRLGLGLPCVRDYSCGFRAYKPWIFSRLKDYRFNYRSFACMTELLVCCGHLGAVFAEVPFGLRYDLKKGASKMPVIRTIKENLNILGGSSQIRRNMAKCLKGFQTRR